MRKSAVRIAGTCVLTAALASSAIACGTSGDKKAACDKLQKTIQDTSRQGMSQVSNPSALAQTYADGAATMRRQGKESGDGKVEKAADDAATALESLGAQVKNVSTGGTPRMPDTSGLISAGQELKSACGG